ncbi:MAG TPA: ACP S-malonyltransferase [Cyclobacteriaceae bacterium]|nr:ACP S-malonyltransferase [Cyclobacteriaceae bacterium]
MNAYIFPGQGSQFPGMGKELYDGNPTVRALFQQANDLLGFDITSIMFSGTAEELKQTSVTQPAIYIHSVAVALAAPDFRPDMVAGHSLGEFSALVASKALTYEEGLTLVSRRAQAMQRACDINPSSMAAILGLDDKVVEDICASIDEVVVAANYNSPGQLVISGSIAGVEIACEKLKAAGAKRAIILPVGGAFHSPLMEPARAELGAAIAAASFDTPICPVYQNVDALPSTEVKTIRDNLIAQLTSPVRWTQTIRNMVSDGAVQFYECGPGKVLQGLVKKISPEAGTASL